MSQKYQRFSDDLKETSKSMSTMTTTTTKTMATTGAVNGRSNPGSVNNNMSSSSLKTAEPTIEITREDIEQQQQHNQHQQQHQQPNCADLSYGYFISRREKVRRIVEHLYFRLFGLALIVVDLILLIVDLSTDDKSSNQEFVFNTLSMIFGTYFVVEVTLRIYAKTMQIFFIDMLDTLDFAVISVSFIVTAVYCFVEMSGYTRLVLFGRVVRIVRTVILVRLCYTEPRNLRRGARQVVSENKRRIRTSLFDLDLTYVTDNIIAMSFPSTGRMAFYRNNIKDVAAYLDKNHGPGNYKVYNLCAEKQYDPKYFHGQVGHYGIDDHNVPSLQQIMDFCKDATQWLKSSADNVIAVHCMGGKGRTGTMICSYLVYTGKYQTSQQALDYFADRRTDRSKGEKFQGVETPSQSRYVDYFTKVMTQLSGEIPEPRRQLRLKTIKISALLGVGNGNGSDLQCQIHVNRLPMFNMDFGAQSNCQTDYDSLADVLTVEPINCPQLAGDVRLKFTSRSKSVPRAYEDCAFYFWFNTAFVGPDQRVLRLDRTLLDNPHKPSSWRLFRDHFAIELNFDDQQQQHIDNYL
ncbi:phosphatidylinositol 3,4,5-trisphosphate 3-phosphatase TPTE2-like [Oppia nitens]|uniref:phosphatidylinositol 3,4,5-trisphosphate 3-phosphatase TPTE2-like n=1 Tax=Oppia nitens TaxID=1686743 RepID=UPI0023DB2ED3|nr:phosphatidylinositol 3,4,5-trisphosphate 3-phosphatase TPTE2-like [Oppia nitens]